MSETHSLAPGLTVEDVQFVSPALAHYTQEAVMEGVWKRPQLSPRDRGLITVAALIARSQTLAMPHYFEKALDSGVNAGELSEIILHLAFYSGFPNAMAAINSAKDAFQKRGISPEELPPVRDKLLPLNEKAESQRATQVANTFGAVSPGLVQNTTDLLFRDFGFAQLSHRATGVSSRSPL
jgi:4-carboxymuconolactone decarboxylase